MKHLWMTLLIAAIVSPALTGCQSTETDSRKPASIEEKDKTCLEREPGCLDEREEPLGARKADI